MSAPVRDASPAVADDATAEVRSAQIACCAGTAPNLPHYQPKEVA